MLQWISRQREVMEQFPAASSSHPAPREYDRDLQCPSLSGEQEERTYLQVERWPRYAAYEDERQDNSEARRTQIVQNAHPFMEKEVHYTVLFSTSIGRRGQIRYRESNQ
ncbi:uncharacterized protein [Montipora capricornis]|uniref:uncharacterized protein n=1 Tax=Montipora capricornis TaxID=246305 RepID=UPI0035F1F5F7